jgi:hypothetical protein
MALSAALEKAGHPVTRIETRAAVTIETGRWRAKVTKSELDVAAGWKASTRRRSCKRPRARRRIARFRRRCRTTSNITLRAKLT